MRNRCRRINNLEFYFGTEDVKKKMQMSYRVCVCVDRGGVLGLDVTRVGGNEGDLKLMIACYPSPIYSL